MGLGLHPEDHQPLTTTGRTNRTPQNLASSQDHIKYPHCHKHIADDLRNHVGRLATREFKGASVHQEMR